MCTNQRFSYDFIHFYLNFFAFNASGALTVAHAPPAAIGVVVDTSHTFLAVSHIIYMYVQRRVTVFGCW